LEQVLVRQATPFWGGKKWQLCLEKAQYFTEPRFRLKPSNWPRRNKANQHGPDPKPAL